MKKLLGDLLRSKYNFKIRWWILCNFLLLSCILSSIVILSINGANAVSSSDATARGCRDGGFQNRNRVDPHYVSVLPGNVQTVATGEVRESRVTHEDWPFDHTSHDRTWLVKVDPGLENLNSEANFRHGNDLLLEHEWEIGTVNDGRTDRFPKQFWPSDGDKMWTLGRWIFDCGHPPARSEIHPPSAVAFSHFEPFIFPIAGMEKLPVLSTKTSIYVHGQGGYFSTNVADRDYIFDVELPPKPTASSMILFDVQPPDRISQSEGVQLGNAPILDKGPFLKNGKQHITIRYSLNSFPDLPNHKFGAIVHAGWVESVGGQSVPSQANTYHVLRIAFDSITKNAPLNSRLDPTTGLFGRQVPPTHTWDNLWVDVNGQHIELLGPQKGRFFSAAHGNPSGNVRSLFGQNVDVIVPDNGALKIKTTGWLSSEMDQGFGRSLNVPNAIRFLHSDTNPEFLGIINTLFDSTKNFGIGATHNDCSGANKIGGTCEFTLRYTITELERLTVPPPTPAPIPPTPAPIPPTPRPIPPSPFPAETCDPNSRMLKRQSPAPFDPKVEELQTDLTILGYGQLLEPFGIDGKFGQRTEAAVRKFQQDNGLLVDGIVGRQTWGAICSALQSTPTPTPPILTPSISTKEMRPIFVSLVSEQQGGGTTGSFSDEGGEDSEVGEIFAEQDWIMENDTGGVTFEQLESLLANTTNPVNATFDDMGNLVIQPVTNYINDSAPQQQPISGSLNNSMIELLSQTEGVIVGSPISGSSPGNFTFEQISAENVTAPANFTTLDNFTQPLQPSPPQQQPLVDEFGNIIPTEPTTDNFTQPLQPTDNFTQPLQPTDNFTQPFPPPEATMTAQVEVCDNFVDDDGDGFVDFDDSEGCVPAATPEGNMTVQPPPSENVTAFDNFTAEPEEQQQPSPIQPQADNFTQQLSPTEPLVDEFGNIIPTEPTTDNFTQPLQPTDNFTQPFPPPEATMTAQVEVCDNFVDDDGDGFVDFDDPEGCSPVPIE